MRIHIYSLERQCSSPLSRGLAGSPYAIKDYYDIDPDLAIDIPKRMKEFEDLIERTHAHDLQVILDFVPNHVARQYHSDVRPDDDFGLDDDCRQAFSPENDFYYINDEEFHMPTAEYVPVHIDRSQIPPYYERPARATGNDVFHSTPSMSDWFDTVKLNYGTDFITKQNHFHPQPVLWKKMFQILCYWIDKGVDGFRCDMVSKADSFQHMCICNCTCIVMNVSFS
jgi:glycosidase